MFLGRVNKKKCYDVVTLMGGGGGGGGVISGSDGSLADLWQFSQVTLLGIRDIK